MGWTEGPAVTDSVVWVDQYGNAHLKDTETGQFVSKRFRPAYGTFGYGEAFEVGVRRV